MTAIVDVSCNEELRWVAIRRMLDALALLDQTGPLLAAGTLALAITQAGGVAPEPDPSLLMHG